MPLRSIRRSTILVFSFFILAHTSYAQNNVGIGTATPAPSAQLDVVSTTKGMLIPRVTTSQMNAIASPATGLLVYNTDSASFAYRDASGWLYLRGTANKANGWTTLGNSDTDPETNFIGTIDLQPVLVRQNNVRAGLLLGSKTSWGVGALNPASTGIYNSAFGAEALSQNFSGTDNTANGFAALFKNTIGNFNTAHGAFALFENTEGSNNTTIGRSALYSNTTGFSNVAVGIRALRNNTTRSNLVAVGDSALHNNGLNATATYHSTANTAVGSKALFSNTSGYNNTAHGADALYSNTSGSFNTANGREALYSNTTGLNNTANGESALRNNTKGNGNTAFGASTLYKNTEGAYNTANGVFALYSNTTGKSNTANGEGALSNNSTGNFNTAHGVHALINNTTGFSNVAVGIEALLNNTTSSNLVAVGDSALYNNGVGGTSIEHGIANTAVGSKALFTNTLGFHNTAIGLNALFSNTTGWRNTAHGVDALFSNTTGNNNTALGFEAGLNNQSGHGNVFLGRRAGGQETGSNKLYINNEIGDAGNALLYGEFDTDKLRINNKLGIGRLPAAFPLEIQAFSAGTNDLLKFFNATGTERWHLNLLSNGSLNFVESNVADNRLVLGVGGEVGVGKVPLTASIDSRLVVKQKGSQNGIGIEAANSSNHWDFYTTLEVSSSLSLYYNGAIKGTFAAANGAYTQASDRRLKKDITRYQPVLDKLNQLEAFSYHYADNDSNAPLSTGFMAQDVQKLFPEAVSEMDMKNGEKMLGINYQYFTVAAIKGLQEQQEMIANQEERIAKLEALIKTLTEKK